MPVLTRRVVVALVLAGCGPAAGTMDDAAETTGSSSANTANATASTTSAATSIDPGTSTSGDRDSTSASADADATSEGMPPDLPGCAPLSCRGNVSACTDGEDNDDDGLVDLFDPECTSVCDEEEDSLQTGLPADDQDCKQDCIGDGNNGAGDDGCSVDLKCDPQNPGALVFCEYSPRSTSCPDEPVPPTADCIDFCTPFVLPGCDCFGCCTFTMPDGTGTVDVYLESNEACRVDNLGACQPCTSRIEACGNPCTPDACEICIGGALPPTCLTNTCDAGTTCAAQDDCACGEVCQLGCCLPLPPG